MKQNSTARQSQLDTVIQDAAFPTTLVDQQELSCSWLPDTTLVSINDAYCRFFGKAKEELLGTSFLTLIPASDRDALEQHIRQLLDSLSAAQPAIRYEHAAHTANGETCWQEWVDRAIFDATGRIIEMRSVGRDISDRKHAEDALQQSQRRYETLMSNLPGLVYRCRHDENWTMEFASAGCQALTGYSSEAFVRDQSISWMDIVHPDDLQSISDEMDVAISERRSFELEYRIITASGAEKWVWEQGQAIYEDDGDFSALEGFITDITEQTQIRQALFEQKEQALITLSSIADAVITTGPNGNIKYLNPAAESLTGWTNEEAAGRQFSAVCHILNEETRSPVDDMLQVQSGKGGAQAGADAILLNRYGLEYAVEETVSTIRGRDDSIRGMVAVFRDVTEARRMQKHIAYQATHDSLTGLENRCEFERRLQELLSDPVKSCAPHALCYLDLDQFKVVNDTCGHVAGDELLRQLAAIMRTVVRDSDTLARLGGDEFGILLPNCHNRNACDIAGMLLEAVQDFRFVWDESTFTVGASIGVVPVDGSCEDKQTLLSAADAACYAAKESGRNRVHFYENGDTELARRQGEMQWVSRIHQAIEEDRFELFHQTIAPLQPEHHGRGLHYELLIRMRDETDAVIPPGAFLPAAERYGLMPLVDRWVIQRAFQWLSSHPSHLQDLEYCAINLSGTSISDERFLDFLVGQFSSLRIPAGKICFEITETAAIANLVKASNFISTLNEIGCSFALDDFGSGMSSFAYLKKLPVDFLKIEGMFVRDIGSDPVDFAMVKSINELGHAMGKRTIAEFVESREIMEKLLEIGVDYVQGYGIARPEPLV
jgi:diguanylate cyclase (GGDEF)-like protein/PAS domain S-box-containing protein